MKGIGSLHFSARMIGVPCRAFIVAIACFASLSVAHAEVQVSGSRDAVTVQAKNALLGDIIVAINSTLNVKISVAPAINVPITGTYSGTLRRVFARMLAGHDFILNSSGDRMTIIVSTQGGPGPVQGAPAKIDTARARANVAATDDEANTSGVQGWCGAFTFPK
ncbi:MAG TPA: hypothetical protein VNR65_09365 [Geobacterales bacterium]|nr:hypothetical protein [Geobacterales bacterium]